MMLRYRRFLLRDKLYFPESIKTMLWSYALKALAKQLKYTKVDEYMVTPIETFAGTGTYINLQHQYSWSCPVYVFDAQIQSSNTPSLPKWDPCGHVEIYFGHSTFHARSVALKLNIFD